MTHTPLTFVAGLFSRLNFISKFLTLNHTKSFPTKDAAMTEVMAYLEYDCEAAWLLTYRGKIDDAMLDNLARSIIEHKSMRRVA